jgi:hypothetical protein
MDGDGFGWKMFAGVMILIGGTMNFIDGLVGLTNASYFNKVAGNANIQLPATNDLKTWSWVMLIIGVIMWISGFLIFTGNLFGRFVGVLAASVNAILQLAYLAHFPFWSFTMILVDILVIWGLIVHGGRYAQDELV